MFMNPEKKDSSELNKRDSWLSSRSLLLNNLPLIKRKPLDTKPPSKAELKIS